MPGKRREYDGQFALCSIGFTLTDPRLDGLTASQKWINHVLWCLAVKERSETLPPSYYPPNPKRPTHNLPQTLARLTREDPRTIPTAISKLQQKCLISVSIEGAITICGVRDKHPNLKWKDRALSPNNGSVSVAQSESESETETEVVHRAVARTTKEHLKKERPKDPIWEFFSDCYQLAYRESPTPTAACFVNIARIRKAHADEVIKQRVERLFLWHPDWQKGRWTFLDFVRHFDKIPAENGDGFQRDHAPPVYELPPEPEPMTPEEVETWKATVNGLVRKWDAT